MASSNVAIVSADQEAHQALIGLLDECGLTSTPVSTVKETESILGRKSVSAILCSGVLVRIFVRRSTGQIARETAQNIG